MQLYKKFLKDGIPEYLARHYWWAYLWQKSIWFFDHQFIINTILFGQYNVLLSKTLAQIDKQENARLLQLTCVYGQLTPSLLGHIKNNLHLCDIADGQLRLAKSKTAKFNEHCHLIRMNAESLAYANDTFDQVIVFFLLHELPHQARQNVYNEIARVVKPNGSVLITEYAALPNQHWLYKFLLTRQILCYLEPFLLDFWREDVVEKLRMALQVKNKNLLGEPHIEYCFGKFYRVMHITLSQKGS